ncbi:DUF1036 domain-containing protein [Phyllobacterium endophyticum]|uniref:DUF1036 domain-containing protein n=1 Tax=Phyllobacterium endophyticum TaxID=1149773 RepID=UPI0011C8C9AD|nr:DUF1036 domain-containing protein [Phyllobacterium endophyticum]TXR49463.1 DUF1036 domain-containing protein [Phyllobacterium endophyticum]
MLLTMGILLSLSGVALADGSAYFCNKTSQHIQVAVAQHRDDGIETQGWLNVPSGYCDKVRSLSASETNLYWVARTKPTLDINPPTSWETWEEAAQDAPILCVGKEADKDFHFDKAGRDKKCKYRMRFSTLIREPGRDVIVRLIGREKPLATSDDSPIRVVDRNGDLVPKTLVFHLACSTKWNGSCEERRVFELPPEAEYCSHFMHIAEMNHGSASVSFTAPGYTHAWVYSVGSGQFFDRWGGNAHEAVYVGVVPFGQHSENRCFPHASWLGYCDLPGGDNSGCSGRCANLSELDQIKDVQCMQNIKINTLRWLSKNPLGDVPGPSQSSNVIETGFPAKFKDGDVKGKARDGLYFSIVGSFHTRAAALRHMIKLQETNQNYDLDVYLPFSGSRYWVVTTANYSTLPNAKSAADYARSTLPRHDSFILRMPNATR